MSFVPESGPGLIEGVGPTPASIMLLGDCPDGHSIRNRKPIAGPRESTLEGCLHQAGLTKSEVYITNFLPDITNLSRYWNERSKKVVGDIRAYRSLLYDEIRSVDPKVIVTLGELPAYALTEKGDTSKIRGYPFDVEYRGDASDDGVQVIVIPSFDPGKMIWSNYIWRYYLAHDLKKAKDLSYIDDRDQLEPKVELPTSFHAAKEFLEAISKHKKLSVDIEIANFEVSCIGFAVSPTYAISIPFDMRWTVEQEVILWQLVAKILEDSTITKIGQNFIFDMHILALRMGIITRGPIIDTMMSHSIMYPDFLKSLNFLGSIYTKVPYWKGMVKWKTIKKES